MTDEPSWTAEDVQRRLQALAGAVDPVRREDWSLRAAAAVLHSFDPALLQPFGSPPADREAAIRLLLADCDIAADQIGHFSLRLAARRRALSSLGSPDRIVAARRVNADAGNNAEQFLFDAWLAGDVRPVEAYSALELSAGLRVANWLDGIVPHVPSPGAIKGRIESQLFVTSLARHLGGKFSGRARELRQLREFINWPPTASALTVIRRTVGLSPVSSRPLLIRGHGGIGKTSLVAKVMMDNASAPDDRRFPYAYLDCGTVALQDADPAAMARELLRQVRSDWYDEIGPLSGDKSDAGARGAELASALRSAIAPLQLGDKPLVVVIDSIDDAATAGGLQQRLQLFIDALRDSVPSVRVILIGRAALPQIPVEEIDLRDLDSDSARAFLEVRGVTGAAEREKIIMHVGRSPLTLMLAAQVVREGGAVDLGRSPFAIAADDAFVQAQLFGRLLGHIANPAVRMLTPMATAVRRVTPDVLKDVLAPVAALDVPDAAAAETLFETLYNEVALFEPDEYGSVRMRTDVARIIRSHMNAREPKRVRAIHERAVDYYATRDDLPSRAEELYHRLCLSQDASTLDARWQRGAGRYLVSSIVDLPPDAQAYVKQRLGLESEES